MSRANGEGTIYLRADGRYEVAVFASAPGGGRRRVRRYAKSREEARRLLTELVRQADAGVPISTRSSSIAEYLDYWLREVVKPSRRPKTYQGYELVVRRHLVPGLGRRRLDRLSASDVRSLLAALRERCVCCAEARDEGRGRCCSVGRCCGTTLAPRTVQFVHAVLRNALQNAVREELVARNVAALVQAPSPKYRIGRGLTIEEARRLLKEAERERLYALYVLALYLGLRRAELLGLRWADIDFEERTLSVTQALQRVDGELRLVPPKSEHSVRVVPLPSVCVEALRAHRLRQCAERGVAPEWIDSGLVFTTRIGTPIEPDNLRRSWYPLRRRTGLDVRFRDLRHTCVSLLLDLGVPPHIVREIVGHSTIEVTMMIYAHASLDERRRALQRLDDALS